MITESQLIRVNELRAREEKVREILKAFSSETRPMKVGLVSENLPLNNDLSVNSSSHWFSMNCESIEADLNILAIERFSEELEEIMNELAKYLIKDMEA